MYNIPVDRWGVHTSHCCPKCGCKYCDPDCPVELGVAEAEYLCEYCEGEKEVLRETYSKMSLSELSETIATLQSLVQQKSQIP